MPKKKAAGGKKTLAALRKAHASYIVDVSADDNVQTISSGSVVIDALTGIGGYPLGRITELWGDEGVSKTTLALHACAEVQKLGKAAVYFDYEGAFSNGYARDIGVNIDDPSLFIKFEPKTFEESCEALMDYAEAEDVGLIVIDSITAMTPESFLEGKSAIGQLARNLSQFLSGFVKVLRRNRTACLAVNQVRVKIATSKFERTKEYSSGGKALQFYNSIKIKLKAGKKFKAGVVDPLTLEEKEEAVKVLVKAEVVKNKFAKPFKTGQYWVRYGKGIDNGASLYDMALARSILSKSGSWIAFNFPWDGKKQGEFKMQGEDNVRDLLSDDRDLQKIILDKMDLDSLADFPVLPGTMVEETSDAEIVEESLSEEDSEADEIIEI